MRLFFVLIQEGFSARSEDKAFDTVIFSETSTSRSLVGWLGVHGFDVHGESHLVPDIE